MTSVIKNVIKEMKIKYPNYKFSVCRNSYSCLLILNIQSTEDFAYYDSDDYGYVVCNQMYRTLHNEFKNHPDIINNGIRVMDFIQRPKVMQLEFK